MKRFIPFMVADPVVSVVRLSGVISAGSRGGGISDVGTAPMIEKAFRKGNPKAVALVINSPGGSPVQSSLVAARVRRLAEEKEIPVLAFVEDVAASGGYWLAAAADEIFVDATSVVGSIGVISASFGFHEAMERHGIERRVHTAGKSKSFLDPFRPEKPEDVARLKALQEPIHAAFIDHVRSRRDGKIDTDADLFTGDVWVGQGAVDIGLADGLGHVVPTLKDRFGDKVRFALYGQRRSLLQRMGAGVVSDALIAAEERAMYTRYGL